MIPLRHHAHRFQPVRFVHLQAPVEENVILDRHTVEQRRNRRQLGRLLIGYRRLRLRLVARRRNIRQRLRSQEHDVVADDKIDFLAFGQTADLPSRKIDQRPLVGRRQTAS